jgi:hypothetical protein
MQEKRLLAIGLNDGAGRLIGLEHRRDDDHGRRAERRTVAFSGPARMRNSDYCSAFSTSATARDRRKICRGSLEQ